MAARKKPKPRMFISAPCQELRGLYFRVRGEKINYGVGINELVRFWGLTVGEGRGCKVTRWRYDSEKDRLIMDIDWTPKKKTAAP